MEQTQNSSKGVVQLKPTELSDSHPIDLWFKKCVDANAMQERLYFKDAKDSLRGFVADGLLTGETWNPGLKSWQTPPMIKAAIQKHLGITDFQGSEAEHWIHASLNSTGEQCRVVGEKQRLAGWELLYE